MTAAAPISSRNLPAPWGVCNMCGEAAGLPDPDSPARFYLCAACATERALANAAQHDLEALTGPVIGAWASHWTRAGLPPEELEAVLEQASGAWMHGTAAESFRAVRLRFLRRQHPAPVFALEDPTRQTFAPDALPRVVAFHPADGQHYGPTFQTEDGERHSLARGLDAVILEEADGGRAVVFTGHAGYLNFSRPSPQTAPGFRVPPSLWPAFAVALSGEEKDLPSFAVYAPGQP